MSDELKEFNFEKAIRNPYIKKDWKGLDEAVKSMGDDYMADGRVKDKNQERDSF